MPRLYVPGVDGASTSIELPETEAHHVRHVLRLAAGDSVRVFDGRGQEWSARLVPSASRRGASVDLVGRVAAVPEPSVRVTLAAGILKGDHMDAVVRDATMMGAAAIVPLAADHVAVPARAWKTTEACERWRRVAVASAKQCGRAVVPEIEAPQGLSQVLARRGVDAAVMFVEPASGIAAGSTAPARPAQSALVLVGPEGGWSKEELELTRRAGVLLASLGPRTLRAETMAAIAFSVLWTWWGWE